MKNKYLLFTCTLVFWTGFSFAQSEIRQIHHTAENTNVKGREAFRPGPAHFTITEIPPVQCIPDEARQELELRISKNKAILSEQGIELGSPANRADHPEFIWPTRPKEGFDDYGYYTVNFLVDHNMAHNQFTDYNCGDRSYDWVGGNHEGTDIIYWPYGWARMQEEIMEIVAAAPGVIIDKRDGNYDLNCANTGNPNWNGIVIEHADGSQAWYWHFKNGAITQKGIGESVEAGEYLGAAGSSGSSNWPHLHFEIYDAEGNLVDPWEGTCNDFNADSWWVEQQDYYESRINHISTHSTTVFQTICPLPEEPNEEVNFAPGDSIIFRLFYRDIQELQQTNLSIIAPDQNVYSSWQFTNTWGDSYATADAYWYYLITEAWPVGEYTFKAEFAGAVYETNFNVGFVSTTDITREQFAMYPNPANSELTFSGPDFPLSMLIYDITGRKLLSTTIHGKDQIVDVSSFAEGIYLVQATSPGGKEWSRRLLISR